MDRMRQTLLNFWNNLNENQMCVFIYLWYNQFSSILAWICVTKSVAAQTKKRVAFPGLTLFKALANTCFVSYDWFLCWFHTVHKTENGTLGLW